MDIVKFTSAVSAAFLAGALVAQEESAPAEGEETSAVENIAVAPKKAEAAFYTSLPFCRLVEGVAEVCLPNGEWKKAEEGRFYPFGTSYRTQAGGILEVQFGPECTARISGVANFSTVAQPISVKTRKIVLGAGVLELSLASNLPEGAFVVEAPGFLVKNPAGKSKFDCKLAGDGQIVVARCVTGSFAVEGRHFSIAKMRAADEFKLRSTHDNLETLLYGTSGDYVVTLDVGMVFENVVADDGSASRVAKKKSIEWNLSPDTKIRIQRMLPAIGERMSVDVTTWDAAGEKKNWWTYSEGRAEVNSGEQVASQRTDREELVKSAAEATETTAADVEEESASDASESTESSGSSESSESTTTEE